MIKHIEELYDMINKKEYDIKRLATLNALIDCRFINTDLRFLVRSISSGDEEDIEFNSQILKRTIENVLNGKYSCYR